MTTDPYDRLINDVTVDYDPYADTPAPAAPRPLTTEVTTLAHALHATTARVTLTLGGHLIGHVCVQHGCCVHADYNQTGQLRGPHPFHVDLHLTDHDEHADLDTVDQVLTYARTHHLAA
jgi:hypothetical protein